MSPEFEPTLDVPLEWVAELAGESIQSLTDANGVLYVSYKPSLRDQVHTQGFTLDDVQSELETGYRIEQRNSTEGGSYYVFASKSFKIFVQTQAGRSTGSTLAVATKVAERRPPRPVECKPLWKVEFVAIQAEWPASVDAIWAHSVLASPFRPPRASKRDFLDRLWRYQAFEALLHLLSLKCDHAPRSSAVGRVIPNDELDAEDSDGVNVLRLEILPPVPRWKEYTFVEMRINDGYPIRTQLLELDENIAVVRAPRGQPPKPGTRVVIEEVPRFTMAAHHGALKRFLGGEVVGGHNALVALLTAPANLTLNQRNVDGHVDHGEDDLDYGDDDVDVDDADDLVDEEIRVESEVLMGEEELSFFNQELTAEQRKAVSGAVLSPHAFFIQGPPGTGKTTVIVEIIRQLVRRKQRIVMLSSTNVAVDEVLKRIAGEDEVLPVRLTWNADKVDPDVRRFTYEGVARALTDKVLQPRKDRAAFWDDVSKRVTSGSVNGSLERINQLKEVEERWLALGRDLSVKEALVRELGPALLASRNLVCATTVGIASRQFSEAGEFDTLIVDEASRITDAEFLIGATRAHRWILVGDEHQLPPYVHQEDEHFLYALTACFMADRDIAKDHQEAIKTLGEAWEEEDEMHAFRENEVLKGVASLVKDPPPVPNPSHRSGSQWEAIYSSPFSDASRQCGEEGVQGVLSIMRRFMVRSLFERGVQECAPRMRARLTEQRRMIEPIARIVREPVYHGDYISADEDVLKGLNITPLLCESFPKPVTFLDTSSHGRDAAEELVGTGFVNDLEARWIVEACGHFDQHLRRTKQRKQTVSILCFYSEQARRIRAMLSQASRCPKLHFRVIAPIDRIQGQETDIVFISFCRAKLSRHPLHPKFGLWLQDLRRLNVAFTRAHRALVLVGHRSTLERLGEHQPFYESLFAMFSQYPDDMQIVHDFGRRQRARRAR